MNPCPEINDANGSGCESSWLKDGTRGVHHPDVSTITTQFTGVFKTDKDKRDRFLRLAGR